MKISELIRHLQQLQEEAGDVSVYVTQDFGFVSDPNLYVAEGGTLSHPYPGLYLT